MQLHNIAADTCAGATKYGEQNRYAVLSTDIAIAPKEGAFTGSNAADCKGFPCIENPDRCLSVEQTYSEEDK